jgi:elongation factor P--(R)-beta-lysine ligase
VDGRTDRRFRRARVGGRLTPTLAPSDLGRAVPRAGTRVRVGGRLAEVRGRTLRIADAFATVQAALAVAPPELQPGDLLVVSGIFRGKKLTKARVEERQPAPAPDARGEHARLSWTGVGPRLSARARALGVIRDYFREQDFVEVDTPHRVRTPGLDLHVQALRAEGGYLATSPEFHMKRLLVGGMPRIYQLGHCFRADEEGPQHEAEFMMLEWYRAFASYDAVMLDTERLVVRVVAALAGRTRLTLPDAQPVEVRAPFARVTVREAFRRFASVPDASALAERSPQRFFELLLDRVEPALRRRKTPVFLVDYPVSLASLARVKPGDPSVAERFELYLGGVELCNGFGELTDPMEQRRRFRLEQAERRALGLRAYRVDGRFLAALQEGLPRASGNALGVDRLVALALGARSIAEVMAFPRARV